MIDFKKNFPAEKEISDLEIRNFQNKKYLKGLLKNSSFFVTVTS
jgi:hypothetical protein